MSTRTPAAPAAQALQTQAVILALSQGAPYDRRHVHNLEPVTVANLATTSETHMGS